MEKNIGAGVNDISMKNYKTSIEKIKRGGVTVISTKLRHEALRNRIKRKDWEIGVQASKRSPEVIISLTSYPQRFLHLDLCIKSLCLQTVKPDRIILWLGNDTSEGDAELLRNIYAKYGVDIRRDKEKNLLSHKKYYYAMQEYPDDMIVTADDDLIYPEDWLESLLCCHEQHPDCICARRVHEIVWKSDGTPETYNLWNSEAHIKWPSHNLLATTGAGTLFPQRCFVPECFNLDKFMKYAKTADDIWLKIMAIISNRKVVWAVNSMPMPTTVDLEQTERLENVNCIGGGNDASFVSLCYDYGLTANFFMQNNDYS